MKRGTIVGGIVLVLGVVGIGAALGTYKYLEIRKAMAAGAWPEAPLSVVAATAEVVPYRPTQSLVGTVSAVRSVTLKNELVGTVKTVHVKSGQMVKAGDVLVTLDTSVDEANIAAAEAGVRSAEASIRASMAEVELANTNVRRLEAAVETNAAPKVDLDRARAEVDRARSALERDKAVVAQRTAEILPWRANMNKKTIRAPFAGRLGIINTHEGQFLSEGTELTTLEEVGQTVNIDFAVPQALAMTLAPGSLVTINSDQGTAMGTAEIIAADARVDRITRNTTMRAKATGDAAAFSPGASVRVSVPVGPERKIVVIPVTAMRKGPGGDHVFVLVPGKNKAGEAETRAKQVEVVSGPSLNNMVMVAKGIEPGTVVAASGSFKLHDGALVMAMPAEPAATDAKPASTAGAAQK